MVSLPVFINISYELILKFKWCSTSLQPYTIVFWTKVNFIFFTLFTLSPEKKSSYPEKFFTWQTFVLFTLFTKSPEKRCPSPEKKSFTWKNSVSEKKILISKKIKLGGKNRRFAAYKKYTKNWQKCWRKLVILVFLQGKLTALA